MPPPQVFALESSVDAIRAHFEGRIAHLESILKVQASTTSAQVAKQSIQEAYAGRNGQNTAHPESREGTYIDVDASSDSRAAFASGSGQNRSDGQFDIETAALSLEVMAGGGGPLVDDEQPDLKPFIPGLSASKEQFAATSIIIRDFDNGIEGNPRLSFLAYQGRQTVVEQVLAYLQSSYRTQPLVDWYFQTIGWVFQVSRLWHAPMIHLTLRFSVADDKAAYLPQRAFSFLASRWYRREAIRSGLASPALHSHCLCSADKGRVPERDFASGRHVFAKQSLSRREYFSATLTNELRA